MRLRPRVEVFCFRGKRVLAGYNPEKDYVLFPGGGIDHNESAIEAAKRETAEEAGRRLTTCTVAHPPTVQKWKAPEDDYDGCLTYWMTGSCSDSPLPELSHPDYESTLAWRPIDSVVAQLRSKMGKGGWDDNIRVQLTVLEGQSDLSTPVRFADALASAK